eukprot:scaffold20398_cov108-Skeletonema_dohrnii-CCMP3373.AAC.3
MRSERYVGISTYLSHWFCLPSNFHHGNRKSEATARVSFVAVHTYYWAAQTHQEVKAAASMASRSSAIQSRDVSSTEVCFTAWSSSPH